MILREDKESSIEAYQLTTVYAMMSISDSNRSTKPNLRTTMNTIKVSTRSAYGHTYVDVIDDKQRGALQTLTSQETLTQRNVDALKVLGFNFELVQDKPEDITL